MLCRYHNLDGAENLRGKDGAAAIMARIHSIQYDPLCVVARNADLVLQARVREYTEEVLSDLLYTDHTLVDGYDKEMSIYEARDFGRFTFVREGHEKQVVATLRYRNQLDALEILEDVKDFVAKHGRTGTKDITIGEAREGRWGHRKLSSAALDYLFSTGALTVADKKGTQKYFDLTERVLGPDCLSGGPGRTGADGMTDDMTIETFCEWYVERRIQSVGLLWNKRGGAWQGHFVSDSEIRSSALHALEEQGRIEKIQVEGIKEPFYLSKSLYDCMNQPSVGSYARFIAPLDNIMWDRDMLEALFGFEYRWEVYTPAAKRRYGYYVLPVLYNGNFVARFEPEPVRKAGKLVIKNWWWEDGVTPDDEMRGQIMTELERFAEFLHVEAVCPKL